jgi:hypothetical protein
LEKQVLGGDAFWSALSGRPKFLGPALVGPCTTLNSGIRFPRVNDDLKVLFVLLETWQI